MTEMPIENEFVDPVRAAAARMHRIHFLDDATPPRQRSSTVTIPQPMPKSTAVTDDYPFPEDSDEDKFENAHVAKASSDTNTAQSTTSKSSSSRQPSEAARPQPSRIPQKNAPSSRNVMKNTDNPSMATFFGKELSDERQRRITAEESARIVRTIMLIYINLMIPQLAREKANAVATLSEARSQARSAIEKSSKLQRLADERARQLHEYGCWLYMQFSSLIL